MSPIAITAHTYPQAQQKALTKIIDLSSDSMKVLLLTAYTYNDSHATLADVLAAGTEVGTSGTGYSSGGIALSGVSVSTSAKVTTLTATSPTLTVPLAGTVTFAYLVFADTQGGANTTRYPVSYVDLGASFTYNDTAGGTEVVTIQIPGGGLATWTAS